MRVLLERVSRAAGAIALAVVAGSCTSSPTEPSNYAPFTIVDLRVGSGDKEVVAGDELLVDYTGWFYDPSAPDQKGIVFDTSRGATPFQFRIGAFEVIRGWDNGLTGMKEGGIRRLVLPPSYAYEQERNDIVPPNATLLFEVELIDIVEPETEGE